MRLQELQNKTAGFKICGFHEVSVHIVVIWFGTQRILTGGLYYYSAITKNTTESKYLNTGQLWS
jgi:hypothetical protein